MQAVGHTGIATPPLESAQQAFPEDPPKGVRPGSSNAQLAMELSRKPYYPIVEDVITSTAACRADFDRKILLMLDALYSLGHLEAACRRLKDILGIMPRSHVLHWRGYLFKLLRDFDEDAYHLVKAKIAVEYAEHLPWIEEPTDHLHLRPAAPDFVPGSLGWLGEVGPADFAKVAAHPLHATAPAFDPGMPAWGFQPVAPPEVQETIVASAVAAVVGAAGPTVAQQPPPQQRAAGSGAASSSDRKEGGPASISADSSGTHDIGPSRVKTAAAESGASGRGSEDSVAVAGQSAAVGAALPSSSKDPAPMASEVGAVDPPKPKADSEPLGSNGPMEGTPATPTLEVGSAGQASASVDKEAASGTAVHASGCATASSGGASAGEAASSARGRGAGVARGQASSSRVVPVQKWPAGGVGNNLRKKAAVSRTWAAKGAPRASTGGGAAAQSPPKSEAQQGRAQGEGAARSAQAAKDRPQRGGVAARGVGPGRGGSRNKGRGGATAASRGRSEGNAAAGTGSASSTTGGMQAESRGGGGVRRRWRPAAPWKN